MLTQPQKRKTPSTFHHNHERLYKQLVVQKTKESIMYTSHKISTEMCTGHTCLTEMEIIQERLIIFMEQL